MGLRVSSKQMGPSARDACFDYHGSKKYRLYLGLFVVEVYSILIMHFSTVCQIYRMLNAVCFSLNYFK